MEKNCINHPFINAHWYCKKCEQSYCFDCVDQKHFKFSKNKTSVHVCLSCGRTMEWIGISHIFYSPVKSIIDGIKYSFSINPLLVTLFITIISLFFSNSLIINEFLFLTIWCILTSYAINTAENIPKGRTRPPAFTAIPRPLLLRHIFLIFKQALVFLIVCTIYLMTRNLISPKAAYCLTPIIALQLPFIIIKIITSNTTKKLFNFSAFPAVIKRSPVIYCAAATGFLPVVTMFELMFTYNPVFITIMLSFSMMFVYRILGQIILECSSDLKFAIDYENFRERYTLETLHGFRT